jgi:hypothetical protein
MLNIEKALQDCIRTGRKNSLPVISLRPTFPFAKSPEDPKPKQYSYTYESNWHTGGAHLAEPPSQSGHYAGVRSELSSVDVQERAYKGIQGHSGQTSKPNRRFSEKDICELPRLPRDQSAFYDTGPAAMVPQNQVEFSRNSISSSSSEDNTSGGTGTLGSKCDRTHPGIYKVRFSWCPPWGDVMIISTYITRVVKSLARYYVVMESLRRSQYTHRGPGCAMMWRRHGQKKLFYLKQIKQLPRNN